MDQEDGGVKLGKDRLAFLTKVMDLLSSFCARAWTWMHRRDGVF